MNRSPRFPIPLVFMLLALTYVTGPTRLAAQQAAAPDFQAFSRFDFVPGEKVVGFEDFSQDSIGDFPAKWNTNAAGEIVTVAGKPGRWLKLTRAGVFVPELTPTLPDNFTLEFDLLVPPAFNSGYLFNASIVELDDVRQIAQWQTASNRFTFTAWAGGGPMWQTSWTARIEANTTGGTTSGPSTDTKSPWKSDPVHVAITRQGARMRVYFNQEKMWDVPRALLPAAKYNAIAFFIPNVDAGSEYFVSNVRLAVGAPDTRNKLLTQGKWVTNGILFDVNSDRIRGESYGDAQGGRRRAHRERRSQSADRRAHRLGRRGGGQPRSVPPPRGLGEDDAHDRIQDRRRPHGHRRQRRERAGRQSQHVGGQGQQPPRRVHQEVGGAAASVMRMLLAVGAAVMAGAGLVAQSQLAQLGLTETAARTFVLNEIKGPAAGRGAPIEVAGTRAFLKLPPAARGPAATALFAWAKSYVSSPAFMAATTPTGTVDYQPRDSTRSRSMPR